MSAVMKQVKIIEIFLFISFSGEIRECFPTTFKLGRRNNPVKVTDNCQLQRTQNDPNSSIRACICTSDYCNDDLFDNNNQVGGNNFLLHSFSKNSRLLKMIRLGLIEYKVCWQALIIHTA